MTHHTGARLISDNQTLTGAWKSAWQGHWCDKRSVDQQRLQRSWQYLVLRQKLDDLLVILALPRRWLTCFSGNRCSDLCIRFLKVDLTSSLTAPSRWGVSSNLLPTLGSLSAAFFPIIVYHTGSQSRANEHKLFSNCECELYSLLWCLEFKGIVLSQSHL